MRRAACVALAVLVLAVALGWQRAGQDIDEEVAGAQALAHALGELQHLGALDDAAARARLAALREAGGLRHLTLSVRDAQGRELLGAHAAAPQAVGWALPRPDGPPWQVSLVASAEAERHEAVVNLGGTLALLLLCIGVLLLAMRRNTARALRPLDALLAAIAGVERDDPAPLRALAPMPIQELEAIAGALRHLAASLDEAQARRRLLGQKVLTLQEDERAHLARELHDELGQRLTAMRVDAAWLLKKLPSDDERHAVVQGLAAQCEQIQADVRHLLARLRPLGGSAGDAATEPAARLGELLQPLVDGWNATAARGVRMSLALSLADPAQPVPSALVLGVYRLSQEALTNVARHAGASGCALRVALDAAGTLAWQVEDDGVGLADAMAAMQRGNGLAGMQERTWALGSELSVGPARADPARPGLRLAASFATRGP